MKIVRNFCLLAGLIRDWKFRSQNDITTPTHSTANCYFLDYDWKPEVLDT